MGIDIYINCDNKLLGHFQGKRDMLLWWSKRKNNAHVTNITACDIGEYLIYILTFPSDNYGNGYYDFLIPSDDGRYWDKDFAASVQEFLTPFREALKCLQEGKQVTINLSF